MSQLLLVEFVAVDQPKRALLFPYVAGWCRSEGISCEWVRYGSGADRRRELEPQGPGVGLSAFDLQDLHRRLVESSPGHVLFNERPQAPVTQMLESLGEGIPYAVLGEGLLDEDVASIGEGLTDKVGRLRGFLGLPEGTNPDEPVIRAGAAEFSYAMGNSEAQGTQRLTYLVRELGCSHRLRVSDNRDYSGLILPEGSRYWGCTFCALPRFFPMVTVPWDKLAADVRALRDHLAGTEEQCVVRLIGNISRRFIEELTRFLPEIEDFGATWQLDIRTDQLVALEADLGSLLATLKGSGHRIQFATIGLESLVQSELDRFCKGVTVEENLRGVAAFLRLAAAYPESLVMDEQECFSTITYTPWTTLEDLRGGIQLADSSGLESLLPTMLSSRLRLMPGRPITLLAQSQGLVSEAFFDPAYETSLVKMYDPEVPWRFGDPRVDPVCRILVRLDRAGDRVQDDLTQRIRALAQRARRMGVGLLTLGLMVIDTEEKLSSRPAPQCGAEDVLSAVEDTVAARERGLPTVGTWEVQLSDVEGDRATMESLVDQQVRLALAAVESGLKPVLKVERTPRQVLEAMASQEGLVHASCLPNTSESVQDLGFERNMGIMSLQEGMYLSKDADLLARIRDVQPTTSPGVRNEDADVAEVGVLLGYPRCCSEAFSREGLHHRFGGNAWLSLRRRVETPGPVDRYLNPTMVFDTLCFRPVPCRLGCSDAITFAHSAAKLIDENLPEEKREPFHEAMGSPWLLDLESDVSGMELYPTTPPGDKFRFIPRHRAIISERMRRAAQGDEIVMDGARLRVLKQGELLVDLTGTAMVWWHERAFQRPLWEALFQVRDALDGLEQARVSVVEAGALDAESPENSPSQVEVAPKPSVFVRRVSNLMLLVQRHPDFRNRLTLHPPSGARELVAVSLANGDRRVDLMVSPLSSAAQRLLSIGPMAVSHATDTPLDNEESRALVSRFVAVVQEILRSGSGRNRTN